MSKISIYRGDALLDEREAQGEVQLCYYGDYRLGDSIVFESDTPYAVVSVDQMIAPSRVYLPEKCFTYRLPLSGDNADVYPPYAFQGEKHLLSIKPDEYDEYRNLALNPADQRGDVTAYPHVTANVETRGESQFAARNVVDGSHIAYKHGYWPFQSWGIGAREDAEITLNFGREVTVDAMVMYLRADFPHDAYWEQGTVVLSDGFEKTFPLQKLDGAQRIELGQHRVSWMKLTRLKKNDDPSAFPALRQWEVYGTNGKMG